MKHLIKIARDTATQRAKVSRRIICIYLTGSVLEESPLLGGTTDIDLIIIHDSEPLQQREIIRVSDEVHLDIGHYDQAIFHQPRQLRTDPWLGPFIYKKPLVLHDTQHWFDFIQAATGAQFLQPEYVIQRASKLLQTARQQWMDLELSPSENHAKNLSRYLDVIENAGNALVSLTSDPISERKFFLSLPQRLQAMHQPELTSMLVHLLVPESTQWSENWPEMLQNWGDAFQAACKTADAPVHIQACRFPYYERAISAIWDENVTAALWLMMRTWATTASTLEDKSPQLAGWRSAINALHLDTSVFPSRLADMDKMLDHVEEKLETWAQSNGISTIGEI